MSSVGGEQVRFSETLRLPWRFLRWWIGIDVVATVFLAWLWSIASMSGPQRVGTGVFILVVMLYLWGGALWFVAAHVAVRGGDLTRRVGYRRTRTALSDITATRVEPGGAWTPTKIILSLRDGTEREIRRNGPMISFVRSPHSAS